LAELTAATYQFISQSGTTRLIDATNGVPGPRGTVSFLLVGSNGYHNGTRLPHEVDEDLKNAGFEETTVEGIDYYLVPEYATNVPGILAHYAQQTGVADLQNPPGGGVNTARGTLEATADASVDPEGVSKFVQDNDSWEEARTKRSEELKVADRAVDASTPAREPSTGALVSDDSGGEQSEPKPSSKPSEGPKPHTAKK
jgi:hypothetical protein